jgi:drug/metabolite transporter (DMT)-like permease
MVVLTIGAVLLAAVFYALASIYAKFAFRGTPALSLTIGQELLAGTLMLPLALADRPVAPPSLTVVGAVAVLGLVMTAGGNLLYFYLLDHVGPTKTQSVAFLIPVFALLASVVFLGEPVTGGTLLGMAIILAGVGLVIEVRMRLAGVALSRDAMLLDSARIPIASRLSGAWLADRAPVYDRHSTRRDSHERRSAMCI